MHIPSQSISHIGIILLGFLMIPNCFADVTVESTYTPETYEEFIGNVNSSNGCGQWKSTSIIAPDIDYPRLSADAVNATLAQWRNNPRVVGDEKARFLRDLDPVRIGNFSGYKTLEVARIGYRTEMNAIFACAVLSSRINVIDGLTTIVNQKIRSNPSEITKNLETMKKKMEQSRNTLKCGDTKDRKEMLKIIVDNSMYHYCKYRYYLEYLESNTTKDLPATQTIEAQIGNGNGTQKVTTTEEWAKIAPIYSENINKEILRADATLPKALSALMEMDKTFSAHIVLMMIYDDYMKLRDMLSRYMNISSQIYQKANNAQSSNK